MAEEITHWQLLFTGLAELGPIPRHRRIEIETALAHEPQRTDGGHALCRRVDVGDRVAGPRFGVLCICVPRPEVDHGLVVDSQSQRGAGLAKTTEALRERVAHAVEARVACTFDPRCGRHRNSSSVLVQRINTIARAWHVARPLASFSTLL